jgi:hypothetical protein
MGYIRATTVKCGATVRGATPWEAPRAAGHAPDPGGLLSKNGSALFGLRQTEKA